MVNEDRPVGVVVINGEAGGKPFGSAIISVIRAATEQAAIALENAQLYDRLARFNQELEETVRQRTAEIKQANEELERVNLDLERLDRTKSDFINIAAHELKTPLTLIQGYASIIRDDKTVSANPFLINILNGLMKGGERLHSIIESMIDVSVIDSQVLQLRPVQTSIGNLIRSVAAEYKQDLQERDLQLRIKMPDDLPYVEADAKRIYQVLDNLVVNAIKYTPDGGWIEIRGSRVGTSEGTEWVEVVVSDSGIGIDPEHLERIFEKFYQTGEVALHSTGRTKFKGGGPGLGLAIAKGIIEAHGGKVWAESERHDEETCPGSRFHVVLPVTSLARTAEIPSPFSYTRSST
jgi:signal transduction histidine kinase